MSRKSATRKLIKVEKVEVIKQYICECNQCGTHFSVSVRQYNDGVGKFCGLKCAGDFQRLGKKSFDGYVQVYDVDRKTYVFEHRVVVEKNIGRCLDSDERVIHQNGIRDDNRFENLSIVDKSFQWERAKQSLTILSGLLG